MCGLHGRPCRAVTGSLVRRELEGKRISLGSRCVGMRDTAHHSCGGVLDRCGSSLTAASTIVALHRSREHCGASGMLNVAVYSMHPDSPPGQQRTLYWYRRDIFAALFW